MDPLTLLTANVFPYLKTLFSEHIFRIFVALLIVIIGLIIGKVSGLLVDRFLQEIRSPWRHFAGTVLSLVIYGTSALVAVHSLGLTKPLLAVLVLLMLAMVLVSALVAMRDLLPNLSAGLFLTKTLEVGEIISIGNVQGILRKKGMFEIEIETPEGIIFVPNAYLFKEQRKVLRSLK